MRPLITIAILVGASASNSSMADNTKCFATWTEAAPIVRREALVAVEQISHLARASFSGGEVVKTTLCEERGRYVYRLVVREPKGQLKTVSVDARKPFAN